jgi:predicted anti-sigma-YlaC factor YlaD
MNHEHYQQLISEFIDGETGVEAEQELFEHLHDCRSCCDFLKSATRMQVDLASQRPMVSGAQKHVPFMPDRLPARMRQAMAQRRISIRTVVMAIVVIVLACVMFSTTISFGGGASAGVTAHESQMR